ncbi:LicD family protein [Oribacterium sinus]
MEFPREFFLDEVREGFFIPAMMKRAWAAELEILVEIDRICEKYKLRYFIDYGNLLGAIRHKGFIPWDDDIDIMMMRKDYEIFAEVANAELPKELVFRFPEDDSGNYELFSSVQHRAMLISTDAIGKYHNYLYGAGVDIFPYDYLAKDPNKEKQREDILKSLCILASFPSIEGENHAVLQEEAKKVKKHYGIDLSHSSDYRKTVLNLLKDCFTEFNQECGTKIAYLLDLVLYKEQGKGIFEEQWYSEQSYLDFEFLALPVPKDYRKVISEKYDHYEQIKKAGGAHDYPLYRKMEAAYRDGIGGKLFYEYSINKNDLKKRTNDLSIFKEETKSKSQKPRLFFLPSLYSRWDSMKGLFLEANKDDSVDCFLMPLPYYYKDGLGGCSPAQWDYALYEDELGKDNPSLLDFRTVDLQEIAPDLIFINDPCDEYNLSFMIDPGFFSKKLKSCTKQLIYIPWFVTSEIDLEDKEDGKAIVNAENYAVMPALVHSDYAILQSEGIAKLYQSLLEKESGTEFAKYWKEKLLPFGNPLFDKDKDKEKYASKAIWEKLKAFH